MTWEIFDKINNRWQSKRGLYIRVYKNKHIAFSKELSDKIDSSGIELLYDNENSKIGLRPAETPIALKLRPLNKRKNSTSRQCISAIGFINHFGLDRIIGKTYPISVEENNLYVADIS